MYAMSYVDYCELFHVNCHVNYLVKQSIALSSVSQPRVLTGDTDSLSKSALFCGSGSVATRPGSILDCSHCRYDALMKSGRERALYLQVSWQNHWPLFWCQLVMLLDLPLCGAAIGFTSRTQLIQRTDSQVASVELEDFMTHRHPAHGSQKSS